MKSETSMAWFNFSTEDYEYFVGFPENPIDYVPPLARGLYIALVASGRSKPEAFREALESFLGINAEENNGDAG